MLSHSSETISSLNVLVLFYPVCVYIYICKITPAFVAKLGVVISF